MPPHSRRELLVPFWTVRVALLGPFTGTMAYLLRVTESEIETCC